MADLALSGARVEPIGSYLKALGVFRLVGEQLDEQVRACWVGGSFAMSASPDQDRLVSFLLDEYRPTAVVAPWNRAVERGLGVVTQAASGLHEVAQTAAPRFGQIRVALETATRILREVPASKDRKEVLIRRCRNEFPDEALAWLDAVVVLTASKPTFPLLLGGTGGNLGRGEITFNFLNNLMSVVGPAAVRAQSRSLLEASLFATSRPVLKKSLAGQFDPGAAGGANVGEALVNPWDFVLQVEGALLFAAGVARRMGADSEAKAAMPFTVAGVSAGFGSVAWGEAVKGEIWTPVWRRPATLAEVRRMLTEGRATWSGRQARDALDFARAIGSLGVDRGVSFFVRHVVSERLGQSLLAVPVARLSVEDRPGTAVLAELDPWLHSLRRLPNPSADVAAAIRSLEAQLFEASQSTDPRRWQELLVAVAAAERAVGRSRSARQRVRPVTGLRARAWLAHLVDHTPEFSLAWAMASQRTATGERWSGLRLLLSPVAVTKGRLGWTERPPSVPGFRQQPLYLTLAVALQRRAARTGDLLQSDNEAGPGITVAFQASSPVSFAEAAQMCAGRIDIRRLEDLLSALLVVDWSAVAGPAPRAAPSDRIAVPPAFAALVPLGRRSPVPVHGGASLTLRLPEGVPALLVADRVEAALTQALHRLRVARLNPAPKRPDIMAAGVSGTHLAAALLVPLRDEAAAAFLAQVAPPIPLEGQEPS